MSTPNQQKPFHAMVVTKVLDDLSASTRGLSEEQVAERRKQLGDNALPENNGPSWIQILFRQFLSPLMLILVGAFIVTMVVGEMVDATMVAAAVLVNVIVGFIQEYRASQALKTLRSYVVPTVRVRRGGVVQETEAKTLVPGDIVLIEAGNRVPADGRVIHAEGLELVESMLTGESLPIQKTEAPIDPETVLAEQKNLVFTGTQVVRGRGEFVVTATGTKTEIGRIAELVGKKGQDSTPLQEQLVVLSRILAGLYVLVAAGIFVFGILHDEPLVEMFVLTVALAVAAVPEGLLVAVTVVLAIGMQRMLKRHVLIRRLLATETLGSVSIICTDKTGTITEADMQVVEMMTLDRTLDHHRFSPDLDIESIIRAGEIGVLCNNAELTTEDRPLVRDRFIGSPTEVALLVAGEAMGYNKPELVKTMPRLGEVPFDSEYKFMLTLHDWRGEKSVLMKGAAERVLEVCTQVFEKGQARPMHARERETLTKEAEALTERGLRVLGLAYRRAPRINKLVRHDARDMVFVGFVGMRDPVRPSAEKTIAEARSAGVRTVIVTGDHPRTVRAIACEVKLRKGEVRVMTGRELDDVSDEELAKTIHTYDVFARVEPAHKVRIVHAWKARGEVVSMTGDGVNDAPALKAADIGVALGNGTDVAKEASEMVLLNNNLASIVAAIREGRMIFENIRKVVVFLLMNGFSEMTVILLGILFRVPAPLLAAQILWINFITDGFPAVALTLDAGEKGAMERPPRKRTERILNREWAWMVFGLGTILNLIPFTMYMWLLRSGSPPQEAQTMVFTILSLQSMLFAFSVRAQRHLIIQSNPLQNRSLLVAVGFGILMTFVAIYVPFIQHALELVPLDLNHWVWLSIIVAGEFLVVELVKYALVIRPGRRPRRVQS